MADVLGRLQQAYTHTPLVMLSALAEGADRLVARVALSRGLRLVVPLPMPVDDYVTDFVTGASRAEFDAFICAADYAFVVDQSCASGSRDDAYARLGAYLARHCQVLIALWDGVPNERAGGTAQVVRFQLEGISEPFARHTSRLDEVESGPVYHIVTPRSHTTNLVAEPFTLRVLYPDGASSAIYDSMFAHLDKFNEHALHTAGRLAARRTESVGYLLPGLDPATLPDTLRPLVDIYAVADTLAADYKTRTVWTLAGVLGLGFLAVVFFDLYAHLHQLWALPLAMLAPVGAFALWHWSARRAAVKTRYLDYRALAEGLRVQLFWRLAGITESAADHYLRKQKGELDWIRSSLRGLEIGSDRPYATAPVAEKMVSECWVSGQLAYFATAAARDHAASKRRERARLVMYLIGSAALLLLNVVVLLPGGGPGHVDTPVFQWEEGFLIVIATLVPALAALADAHADKMGYDEEAKQYQRMQRVFTRAAQHLNR